MLSTYLIFVVNAANGVCVKYLAECKTIVVVIYAVSS